MRENSLLLIGSDKIFSITEFSSVLLEKSEAELKFVNQVAAFVSFDLAVRLRRCDLCKAARLKSQTDAAYSVSVQSGAFGAPQANVWLNPNMLKRLERASQARSFSPRALAAHFRRESRSGNGSSASG